MKLLRTTSLLGLLLMSAASTVSAAEPESQHGLQQTPFYFGLDVAYLRQKNQTRDFKEAWFDEFGTTPSVKQDRNAGAGRIFAGYSVNENLSLELAYFKTTKEKIDASDNIRSASIKYDAKGVELSGLFSPSQFPNFFVKAGAIYSELDARISASAGNNVGTSSVNDKGWGYVAGFGYKYPINQVVDIKATYAYYGRVAGDSDSHLNLLSLGFQYHF